jgi:hypothetical protein
MAQHDVDRLKNVLDGSTEGCNNLRLMTTTRTMKQDK